MAEHLCVLIHGLWGNPNHLANLRDTLQKQHPEDKLHILVAKSNADSYTYDGIGVGGERITNEIEQKLQELEQNGAPIKKLSIVGYSLGGLVARYAIGLLYKGGLFDRVQPVNFTTFATPHMGVRSPSQGSMTYVFNVLGSRTLSASGQQMFLTDNFQDTGRPLLAVMADPNSSFIKGLSLFKNKSLYANIINDRSVPFFTSYITKTDPYVDLQKVDLHYLHHEDNLDDPVLLDPRKPVSPTRTLIKPATFAQTMSNLRNDLPFYTAFALILPLGITGFLINSGYQTYASARRITMHEAGKAGVSLGRYRIPLLEEAQSAQARLQTQIAGAQGEEYLPTPPPEPAAASSSSSLGKCSSSSDDTFDLEKAKSRDGEFPTLALTDEQFEIIENLDRVGIEKFPVYIKQVRHTHAAIIVRTSRVNCEEGRAVGQHWAKRFEV